MRWIHSRRKSPLRAPVVVAVDQGVGDLLLGLAVEPRALAAVTAGRSRTTRRFLWALTALFTRANRCQHHDHVAAVLLRGELHVAGLGHVLGHPLQQPVPQLGPGLLTTTEHDRDLHLVPGLEEALDVALLGLVVVVVDLRPELLLLDLDVGLVPPSLARLHRRLVLELAVVHELDDRRPGVGGHLDQVQVGLLGQPEGVLDADDAHLLAVGSDQPDLGNADAVVDAGFDADGSSSCSGASGTAGCWRLRRTTKPPSNSCGGEWS
jgi:hypothetical protein